MLQHPTSGNPPTLTVGQLNREARRLLESHFDYVWVEGEISNFAAPSSGHWYFSLKDSGAQVRCAMFRNRNQHMRVKPANGMAIRLRCRVSLYEGRGEFQLIVEHREQARCRRHSSACAISCRPKDCLRQNASVPCPKRYARWA